MLVRHAPVTSLTLYYRYYLNSLENRSDIIRWSLDLRWQKPDMDNGFYGLKNCVLMRTSQDPNYKIDWSEMANIDRTKKQMAEAVSIEL